MKELTDKKLVELFRNGDLEAFTVFVRRHENEINAHVFRRIGDRHAAEEITQDVFLVAFSYDFSEFEWNRDESLRGWLKGVAKLRCYDYFRKHSRRPKTVDLSIAGDQPEEEVTPWIDYKELVDFLERDWDDDRWERLQKRVVEEKSLAEVANEVGIDHLSEASIQLADDLAEAKFKLLCHLKGLNPLV